MINNQILGIDKKRKCLYHIHIMEMSNRMTIQQAATELGVSTKTLRRWEEKGHFVPQREPNTNIRLYDPYLVGYWKRMLEFDRGLKNHLKLLDGLRKELDKHIASEHIPGQKVKFLDIESFKKADDAMGKWEKEYKRLLDEIMKYPNKMLNATIEDYDGKEGEK